MMRFGVGLALLLLAVGFVGADEKDEKAKEERAELGCTILKTAIEAYSVSPQEPGCH